MTAKGKNSDFPDKDTLKKYLQGELSPEEAHRFEKHVLQDPFYQDALQGMELLDAGSFRQDMADLSNRIRNRARTPKKAPVYFYRIAAAITLLAVFSYVIYITTSRIDGVSKREAITQKEEDITEASPKEGLGIDKKVAPEADTEIEKEEPEPAERDRTPALQDTESHQPREVAETDIGQVTEDALVSRVALPVEETKGDEGVTDEKDMEEGILYEEEAQDLEIMEVEDSEFVAAPPPEKMEEQQELVEVNVLEEDVTSHTENIAAAEQDIMAVEAGDLEKKAETGPAPVAMKAEELTRSEKQKAQPESRVAARKVADKSMAMPLEESLQPEPVIGFDAYSKYITAHLQYPAPEAENHLEGLVEVRFIINRDSIPAQIRIIRSLTENCDQEAIRLLKEGPKWKPVYVGDQLQEMEVNYTITFELND